METIETETKGAICSIPELRRLELIERVKLSDIGFAALTQQELRLASVLNITVMPL